MLLIMEPIHYAFTKSLRQAACLFVTGFYDDYEEESSEPRGYDQRGNSFDFPPQPSEGGLPPRRDTHSPERPPSYEDVIPPRKAPSVSMSQMPTLDMRARRDRISEYESEDSVEV